MHRQTCANSSYQPCTLTLAKSTRFTASEERRERPGVSMLAQANGIVAYRRWCNALSIGGAATAIGTPMNREPKNASEAVDESVVAFDLYSKYVRTRSPATATHGRYVDP